MHLQPTRVRPLPVSCISVIDRRKIRESPNQALTVFLFWVALLGIPFLGAASAKGLLLVGIATVTGVLFAALYIYATFCQRRMFAFAVKEAIACASRADACSAVIAQFSEVLRTRLTDFANHLSESERALAGRLRETFWDDVDHAYRSLQQLTVAIHAAFDAANKYAINLEGRNHTYMPLACSPDVALFEQVVLRYRDLLVSAEQDHELVQLFELRRHGHSYLPTFTTLKGAPRQAENELTSLVVNLSKQAIKSCQTQSMESESTSWSQDTHGDSRQSRITMLPMELRIGAIVTAMIFALLVTVASISYFVSTGVSAATPDVAYKDANLPVRYVGWFEAPDGENGGAYQLELWRDGSNSDELIGLVSHVVEGVSDPTGRLDRLNSDPSTGRFSFRASMLGENVSFSGHWRGDIMSGTMRSTRINESWSATFKRGDRHLDKNYRQSREAWERTMETILRCCGPQAKPEPRTWR